MSNKYSWALEQLLSESADRLLSKVVDKPVTNEDPSTKMFLENEPEGRPRIRKYTKERVDGSTMTRWEVLDYRGHRANGQGSEGFDDLQNAKDFLRANRERLSDPDIDLAEGVETIQKNIAESQFNYSNIPTLKEYKTNREVRRQLHEKIIRHCWDNSSITLETRESILSTIETKVWRRNINESHDEKQVTDNEVKKFITSIWKPVEEKNLKVGMTIDVVEVEKTGPNIIAISIKENKTIKDIKVKPNEVIIKFTDGDISLSNFSTFSINYGAYFCTRPGNAKSGISWLIMKTDRVNGYRKYGNLYIDLPDEGPYDRIIKKISESDEQFEQLDEDLRKWFKEKWVRFGPDGKIRGDCARGDDSEGKPKCLPQSKAHSLGKKGRSSAASKKRREDPNPDRSGKAINVSTKPERKTKESISEQQLDELKCWPGYTRVQGVPAGAPGSCKKKSKKATEAVDEGSYKRMKCPECGGAAYDNEVLAEEKDACYHKVKSRYRVWPSAYASGALSKCRKVGASNWGNKSKK
jgi:hypothetical protein